MTDTHCNFGVSYAQPCADCERRKKAIGAPNRHMQPKSPRINECYRSADGRVWWINEGHPDTSAEYGICREVVRGYLMHTAIWARKDLTPL